MPPEQGPGTCGSKPRLHFWCPLLSLPAATEITILSPLKKREVSWLVGPCHPPSSRGDGVGGFPLSSGEELPLELFLPGLQGAARVSPSPASVSEHLWVGGQKPKALQGGTEEQISSLETEPRLGLYLLSPQPEIVCVLWMASLGSPGGPAERGMFIAVPRWLSGGVGSLPGRDGECAAQLGHEGWVTGGLELPGAHPAPVAA